MMVSTTHSLNIDGIRAALRYFDSVFGELAKRAYARPDHHNFYFVLPTDIYADFSKQEHLFTDKLGANIGDKVLGKRVKQWILKVE